MKSKAARIGNCRSYQVRFRDSSICSIETGGERTDRFLRPDSNRGLPKLYIIRSGGEVIYVGQTMQGMRTRIMYGFRAAGEHGYWGYKWKHLAEVEVLVCCFPGKPVEYLEGIEGELVFLFRKHTGQWPRFQTEIHFHNAAEDEIEVAETIFEGIRG